MFGERRHPDPARVPTPPPTMALPQPTADHLWTVNPRANPWVKDKSLQDEMDKAIKKLGSVLKLGFAKNKIDPVTGGNINDGGAVTSKLPPDSVYLFLNRDTFKPLITSQLSGYEKFGHQWIIATYLCQYVSV